MYYVLPRSYGESRHPWTLLVSVRSIARETGTLALTVLLSSGKLTKLVVEHSVGGYMQKVFGLMLLIVGASAFAMGGVPEINAGSAGSAVVLISGALLVYRGRRK